ncbi:MAG: tetratricopeptide repeat protein [Gemmatimonadales bacterium]
MAGDIKGLTAELARDPASLVFLQLGEALRARGQVDAAAKVALTGLQRHPDLADAHDVYARVLIDAGNVEAAHEAWRRTLQLDPRHVGAHKGIGFLFYRYGDWDAALDHLETALSVDPTDGSVIQALRRVRAAAERAAAEPVERTADVFAGSSEGILLVDDRGRVLGGSLRNARNEDAAEEVAAYLAGASQEAQRTARLLGLGAWRAIVAEGPQGHLYVSRPSEEALLLVKCDRSIPPGRVALMAERAGAAARAWLEGKPQ